MADYSDVQEFIIKNLADEKFATGTDFRAAFEQQVQEYGKEKGIAIVFENRGDQERIYSHVLNALSGKSDDGGGFGVLEYILEDPDVSEILINGLNGIFVAKQGELKKSEYNFDNEDQIMHIIDLISRPLGQIVNESNPVADLRLADGSLVNVVVRPIALDGPIVTIRKFSPHALTWDDLIAYGSISEDAVTFLKACVAAGVNILISGGVGSGKTQLLANLVESIGREERVILIEHLASELKFDHPHLLRMETRPPNFEGRGEINQATLTLNAMKMRPERIIVREVYDAEAMHLIQAMNTGHDGSMTSVHANTPRDAMGRLENMISIAEPGLPIRAVREQVTSAIDLIIQVQRLRDGSRKVLAITEVTGIQNNMTVMQNIFEYEQTGFQDGRIIGELRATGNIPNLIERLDEKSPVSRDIFRAPESQA